MPICSAKECRTLNAFLADSRHSRDLSALTGEVAMPGSVELIFGRHPDFFHGLDVQGKFNQIGVCYDGERISGMGCRSIKPMYVQGTQVGFGYLNSLRRARGAPRGVTRAIFRLLHEVHQDQRAPGYLTTVVEGNHAAAGAMVQARDPMMPHFFDLGPFHVHAIFLNRRRRAQRFPAGVNIVRGSLASLPAIVAFLQREGARRQFYPCYTAQDFTTVFTRGFAPEDFFLALRKDEIVGVMGVWDQESYKQHQVAGYHGVLRARPVINLALDGLGYPRLPAVGETLRNINLGFVAVADDDPTVCHQLFDAIYQDVKGRDYNLLFAGFHARDPLRPVLSRYRGVVYTSRLYLACWEDGLGICRPLAADSRVPYLELATM